MTMPALQGRGLGLVSVKAAMRAMVTPLGAPAPVRGQLDLCGLPW
jgi:hypothetical protein